MVTILGSVLNRINEAESAQESKLDGLECPKCGCGNVITQESGESCKCGKCGYTDECGQFVKPAVPTPAVEGDNVAEEVVDVAEESVDVSADYKVLEGDAKAVVDAALAMPKRFKTVTFEGDVISFTAYTKITNAEDDLFAAAKSVGAVIKRN